MRARGRCAAAQRLISWNWALFQGGGTDAVAGDQGLGVWKRGGDAGWGYGLGFFNALGDGQVQFQKLGQQVFLGGEAVGGEDGGGLRVFIKEPAS